VAGPPIVPLTLLYAVVVAPELTLELTIRVIRQASSSKVEVLLFNTVRLHTPVAREQETSCVDGAPGNPTMVCERAEVAIVVLVGVAKLV